jgi:2',3'-cyclic-nucleotide 2'-phosphodiesterase (5'-nucleotidase family)
VQAAAEVAPPVSVSDRYRIPPQPPGARTTLVLAINDVYRLTGLDSGAVGGLARVRTLRRELEGEAPQLLFTLAGDFLFPSFLSRTYDGEQMVDVLNLLDGQDSAAQPDERMFVTFGNHEFDLHGPVGGKNLDARIEQSQFRWLSANLEFLPDAQGQPLVAADNLLPWAVVDSGGIRIGLFGDTGDIDLAQFVRYGDYVAAARRATAALRAAGAEVVIGLTHNFAAQDCRLLEALGDDGPDLILGGHEHSEQRLTSGPRWVLKADADARSAMVVRISIAADGRPVIAPAPRIELKGKSPPADPDVLARAASWIQRHDLRYCAEHRQPPGCLARVVGHAATLLEAEETTIRSRETSLGDWLAELMLAAFADQGAQVAFINSGALRINEDVAPGPVTLADIEGIFQYSASLRVLAIDGATLQKVIDHAVEQWPGAGHWLQIAGFRFDHDPTAGTATGLALRTAGGWRPVLPDEPILAVTVDYVAKGGDGYTMLNPDQWLSAGMVGDTGDLKRLALAGLAAAEPAGIAPVADGRIAASGADSPPPGTVRRCQDVQ